MFEEESVRDYYNKHTKEEDHRLTVHPFEMPLLSHFIDRYMKPGERILDVACGTGRIAGELLKKGFRLGLCDLSDENIRLVRERYAGHKQVLFIEQANALEPGAWKDPEWDAALIMGPLYHLINPEKRLQVLKFAKQSVKPGGYIFSSFMTRTGAMIFGLKHKPDGILKPDGVEQLWKTGTDKHFVEGTKWFTNAYFSHPEEVNPLISRACLEPLHLAGAEGIFGERFDLYHQMNEELQKAWMEFILEHCEDPHMVHQSKHMLSVARNPD